MLIGEDEDIRDVLAAEDEAIAVKERGDEPVADGSFTLPDSLAHLLRTPDDVPVQQAPES